MPSIKRAIPKRRPVRTAHNSIKNGQCAQIDYIRSVLQIAERLSVSVHCWKMGWMMMQDNETGALIMVHQSMITGDILEHILDACVEQHAS